MMTCAACGADCTLLDQLTQAKAERDDWEARWQGAMDNGVRLQNDLHTAREEIKQLTAQRDALGHDAERMREWKESALVVLNGIHLQEVGKVLGLPLGADIGPAILPGITSLAVTAERLSAERDDWKARCEAAEFNCSVAQKGWQQTLDDLMKVVDGFKTAQEQVRQLRGSLEWFVAYTVGMAEDCGIEEHSRQKDKARALLKETAPGR